MTKETKKRFTEPDCEILRFAIADMITTSTGETTGDDWKLPEL